MKNKDKQKILFNFLNIIKNIGYKTDTFNILNIDELDSFEQEAVEFDILSKNKENCITINLDYENLVWHLTADSGHFIIGTPVSLNLENEALKSKINMIVSALL
jgi:hypothetical protein